VRPKLLYTGLPNGSRYLTLYSSKFCPMTSQWPVSGRPKYKSALVFISIWKQKNLGCVKCIWDITAISSVRIKIILRKINEYMLYFWLLEITKVRIKFQNYLFKIDKRISYHLGHNRIFSADRIWILPWKINRLLLHFWLLEITQRRIRFWSYVFQADKRISHIQNLSGGYNLNLDNISI
jgi:hypothetical protein